MDDRLKTVTEWLVAASENMEDQYFLYPMAGGAARRRERVYCYELYHQWRCKWETGFPFSLGGEVDKRGHTFVKGKYLSRTIPDYLVHVPGDMVNLLVMEVKAFNSNPSGMVKDLMKLTAYRTKLKRDDGKAANYHAAYFWVYGLAPEKWPDLRDEIYTAIGKSIKHIDTDMIRFYVHEGSKAKAVEVLWDAEA